MLTKLHCLRKTIDADRRLATTETCTQANSLESDHTTYYAEVVPQWMTAHSFLGRKNMHFVGLWGSLLYLQGVSIYIYSDLKTWILYYFYSLPAHSWTFQELLQPSGIFLSLPPASPTFCEHLNDLSRLLPDENIR
jgi:hypothetical protein